MDPDHPPTPRTPDPGRGPASGPGGEPGHDYSYGTSAGGPSPDAAPPMDPLTGSAAVRPAPGSFAPPVGAPAPRPRRPAPAPPATPRRRGPLIALLIGGVVLALVVVTAGVWLFLRPTDPAAGPAATASSTAAADPSAAVGSEVTVDGVRFTVTGIETGAQAVGRSSERRTPAAGEFVAITLEIDNPTGRSVLWNLDMSLVTADGTEVEPDPEASEAYVADSRTSVTVRPGTTAAVHLVYDVPTGSAPGEGRISLSGGSGGGTGTLPLG